MKTAVLWYRRDLRVHDHPGLHLATQEYEQIVPLFVFDGKLLHGRFASAPRTQFMLGCLAALRDELRERGSDLVLRSGPPERAVVELARDVEAEAVIWTSDVAPYARMRDRRVTEALRAAGLRARPCGGNYIVDISKPRTRSGEPYHVFSPFFRTWQSFERRSVHRAPRRLPALPAGLRLESLPAAVSALGLADDQRVAEPVVAPGEAAARRALAKWLGGPIDDYAERQDGVAEFATSRLSPYLRWGCVSAREAEQRAGKHGGKGAEAWIRQLCWRDFYAHVLLAWPGNARHEFQQRMRGLEWDAPGSNLEAWRRGETGYPLVDAGMRELAHTGWMHNRVRLVVGSFLTKDLHLDWRAGESWFERLLLDGEPAQNNGNWQWIASVGVDPAPAYRRIYNPALQAARLDPDGDYVRRWVPELGDVAVGKLFEPWRMSDSEQREAGCRLGREYPLPIVDHAQERRRALERYRAAAQRSAYG